MSAHRIVRTMMQPKSSKSSSRSKKTRRSRDPTGHDLRHDPHGERSDVMRNANEELVRQEHLGFQRNSYHADSSQKSSYADRRASKTNASRKQKRADMLRNKRVGRTGSPAELSMIIEEEEESQPKSSTPRQKYDGKWLTEGGSKKRKSHKKRKTSRRK